MGTLLETIRLGGKKNGYKKIGGPDGFGPLVFSG